jgi:hypothetical protein
MSWEKQWRGMNGKKFIWRFWNSKNKWIRQLSYFYGQKRSRTDWIIKETLQNIAEISFWTAKSRVYGQSSTVNKYDHTLPAFYNSFNQPESSTIKLNSEDLTELNQHADRFCDTN